VVARPMRTRTFSRAHQVQTAYTFRQLNAGSNLSDPFSLAIVLTPMLSDHELGVTLMLTVGWLAAVGLVFCVPILIWSAVAEGITIIRRRIHPPIETLNLTPRLLHILHRHGFDTIVAVDKADDPTLSMLANMDPRDVQQVRRAISLWKYARWQAAGFPATDLP
jgi:hypothetical protein